MPEPSNPGAVSDVLQVEGWTVATRVDDIRTTRIPSLDLADDRALVLAFQSGDIDAYADIFVKYRALVAQICHRILQDRDEAEEAVQETMLRVFRGLPRFNGRYQLQAWVARIATNVALDMIRARSRRPQRGPALDDLSDGPDALMAAADDDTSEVFERILDQQEVRSTLSSLPDHHREALVLRELEGRSHQEIGDALGVSPKQAKALIHRAKKSFRRAWGEQTERRGIAVLVPIVLAPLRLPGLLRKLVEPAREAVAGAAATAQQAVAQVAAAPAVAQSTITVADKVTAAALTVIVAGTVGVGAVAIRHKDRAPKPAAAASSVIPTQAPPAQIAPTPPSDTKPSDAAREKSIRKGNRQTQAGQPAGSPGASASDTPTSDPSPGTDPSGTPTVPPPPPPAPAWSGSFDTSVGLGAANLTEVSQRVTGQSSPQTFFGQTLQGPVIGPKGRELGSVYVDFGGSLTDTQGSLSSLWLWVTTPEGQYRYAAGGTLASVERATDGSTTYVFTGGYSLSSVPSTLATTVPHDGTIAITLRFWSDGTLYATSVSMTES